MPLVLHNKKQITTAPITNAASHKMKALLSIVITNFISMQFIVNVQLVVRATFPALHQIAVLVTLKLKLCELPSIHFSSQILASRT